MIYCRRVRLYSQKVIIGFVCLEQTNQLSANRMPVSTFRCPKVPADSFFLVFSMDFSCHLLLTIVYNQDLILSKYQ